MMKPSVPVCINLVILMCILTILMVITLGASIFNFNYRRASNGQNVSKTAWPSTMSLSAKNFLCSIPSPNLDLSEEQLIKAWQLPPKTRLSPTMRDVARCELAIDWSRANNGQRVKEERCFCINLWWLITVAIISMIAFGYYSEAILCRPIPKTLVLSDLRGDRLEAGFWFLVWYLTVCLACTRNLDAGMSFTLYGHMNSQAYYELEPLQMFLVSILCLIVCFVEGLKFIILGNAIAKITTQQSQRPPVKMDQSPPTYKEAVKMDTVALV